MCEGRFGACCMRAVLMMPGFSPHEGVLSQKPYPASSQVVSMDLTQTRLQQLYVGLCRRCGHWETGGVEFMCAPRVVVWSQVPICPGAEQQGMAIAVCDAHPTVQRAAPHLGGCSTPWWLCRRVSHGGTHRRW